MAGCKEWKIQAKHYCADWLCSLKGSQSYKMCSLLGLELLLEWIFNIWVEFNSRLPTVNFVLKKNKTITACCEFGPLYFSSQIILKLTQGSGVWIKQHFHSYECGSVYEFFPLKLDDKIQADGFQMLTSAFS